MPAPCLDPAGDEARATLPSRVQYLPRHPAPGIAARLPADAVPEGDGGWRFTLPDAGVEPVLLPLIAAGHGIAGLTIERPSLHEAFVRIVGDHAGHDRSAGENRA